ncbi:MAG: coenzyme F420-0:L-glutamate ligase [Candidatus Thorarchaeota archaeon]
MPRKEIQVIPIVGYPIVKEGDDLSELLLSTMKNMPIEFQNGDVVIVSHSIVSIAEDSMYIISEVTPSEKARQIAVTQEHSEERIEIALREASEVIREEPILITKTHHGIITDFSGVDESNAPDGKVIALPRNPDASAGRIHENISRDAGFKIPVIITDTQGRPWRRGAVNLAIGVAGISPFVMNEGRKDIHGKVLRSSLVCIADEIAASTELVMGQADEKVPIAIVRGLSLDDMSGSAQEILREGTENLFQ